MAYSFWLLIFIIFPTAVLWYLNFKVLKKYWRTYFFIILFSLLFSITWDILAVKNGIWFFPEGGHLGLYISNLPIEEYLFMVTIAIFIFTLALIFKYQKK